MTRLVVLQDPRSDFAEPITADKLVGDTCRELDRLGIRVSPPKVQRLVHRWIERVRFTGYPLAEWIADGLALDAERRAQAAWTLRNRFGVVDPTGQRAARTADRMLGLGEGWHE